MGRDSVLTIRISRRVAFLVVLGVFLSIPAGSWASHKFTDVADSNIFHADISWLADAGVTKGCNPPSNDRFCPSDFVTREQMAAFMKRLAEARVVDADTVDGLHASAFALTGDLPTQGGASCAAAGFYPTLAGFDYFGTNPRRSFDSGNAFFVCPLDLPDGATMTTLTASLFDTSTTFSTWCQLERMDVTGSAFGLGNGTAIQLATTADTTGSFGNQTVTTSAIDNPVVDARRYAYYTTCVAGASGQLGINGVMVHYTLP
jgi:hypothetical protein